MKNPPQHSGSFISSQDNQGITCMCVNSEQERQSTRGKTTARAEPTANVGASTNRQSSLSSVSMEFGKTHSVFVCLFVWLFSDERRSVQPPHQVHRGLHRPAQHLHRNGVLPPRQPAGKVSGDVAVNTRLFSVTTLFECFHSVLTFDPS